MKLGSKTAVTAKPALLDKSLGSRHRAALGITEETDAVVVVVSEERGTISFCFNGNVVTNLDGASLRQALLGLFGQSGARKRGKTGPKRTGTVTQTGTGTFRITMPPPSPVDSRIEPRGDPRSARPAEVLPALLVGPSEVTGSAILAAPGARSEAKAETDARPPPSKSNTRPMAPARPIETPKPVTAAPATPTRPTED